MFSSESGTLSEYLGYIDEIVSDDYETYLCQIRTMAEDLANSPQYTKMLLEKEYQRQHDELCKPLEAYRKAELEKMKLNFSGKLQTGQVNYHQARYNFVHKIRPNEASSCVINRKRANSTTNINELRFVWALQNQT